VAEGLIAFLGRDLRTDLEAGFRRTPALSPDGGRWLVRWVLASAFVGLVLLLSCGYHCGFVRLNVLAAHVPDWTWQWLTVLGDERVAFALTLFFARRYPRVFWTLVAAAAIGVALTHTLKPLFSAARPLAVLEAGGFNLIGPGHRKLSFPSGHTVTAAVFFGAWVYYVRSNLLRVPLILLAVAAGLSRVAVGVHWPVDVAAGLAIGALAAWLGVSLARRSERWGADRRVHLVLVSIAVGMALSLLFSDGGYGGAADMQRLLAVTALGYGVFVYAMSPTLRWRRGRRSGD
jgi:membrane-associated phospholipid phosphatase